MIPYLLAFAGSLSALVATNQKRDQALIASSPLPDREGDGGTSVQASETKLSGFGKVKLIRCPKGSTSIDPGSGCRPLPAAATLIPGAGKNGVLDLAAPSGPVHVAGAYRAIETTPSTVASNVVIDGVVADDLQRGGIRLRGRLSNITIRNSTFRFRSVPQVPPNLPACIEAGDKKGSRIDGLLVQNVTCEGFQMIMAPDRYWNGDGPTFEAGVSGLVLDNVTSRNNTDGCFDIKPVARATRIEAEGCKRNVRIWRGLSADQVTSITPVKRGGSGSAANIWIKGNNATPPFVHIGHLIVRSTSAVPILTIEDGPAVVTIDRCSLEVPAGTAFRFGGAGSKVSLGPGCYLPRSRSEPDERWRD